MPSRPAAAPAKRAPSTAGALSPPTRGAPIWLNGHFEGYSRADRFAWHDFEVNPDHPQTPYSSLPLVEGTNHVLIRIRGGRYASGGFFAAVDFDSGQKEP